jgi:hypothetical protein
MSFADVVHDDPYLSMPKEQRIALRKQRRAKLQSAFIPAPAPVALAFSERVVDPPTPKEPWFHIVEEIEPIPVVDFCPRVEDVMRVVAVHFGITRLDLMSDRRTKDLVLPRHIGFYLCKTLTAKSYPFIAKRFGYYDHSVGCFAVKKIRRLIQSDDKVAAHVANITRKIREAA